MIEGMRPLLAVAGWVAAAMAATAIGLAGVQTIGNGITDGAGNDVLSAEQAARDLAAAPPPSGSSRPEAPPSAPSGTPSTEPSSAPTNERVFSGDGGTVRAACVPGGAKLISYSPADGYSVKEARTGPAEHAEVRFDRGSSGKGNGESRVRITCVGGVPVDSWR
jgi:hypothetical protein